MSFVAAAIVGSAVVGGAASYMGGKEARKGQEAAAEMQAESFRFSKPYIERSYNQGEEAYNASLGQGAYSGKTYADANPYQTAGNNYIGNMGAMGAQGAYDLTQGGQGFGQNYNDMYAASQGDRMQTAQNYAMDNSGGLVNDAMRDDRRTLEENTLTGINQGASGSGNMNSSRAGVADAVANRAYDDRKADVTSTINQNLMSQSLGQQNQQFKDGMMANQGVQDSYLQGINAMGTMGDFMTGAGSNLRGFQQGQYNDQRARYEDNRDFALNQGIKYQQGILGKADYNSPQNPVSVTASPMAAGFGGAMQGAGIGMSAADYFGSSGGGGSGGGGSGGVGDLSTLNSRGGIYNGPK